MKENEAFYTDCDVAEPLRMDAFEKARAGFCGSQDAVAVSNGTAALHTAVAALGLGSGDKAIVTPMTFVASVNCPIYAGAEPLFADVDPGTLLMDPESVAGLCRAHGKSVKAIIPVDYAGQPCEYDSIRAAAPGGSRHSGRLPCAGRGGRGTTGRIGGTGRTDLFQFSSREAFDDG